MSEFKSRNAIISRLSKMRGKWIDHVTPQTKAVIWRVEQDEVRMVDAFVAIEASDHGEIPSFFLDFAVPFQSFEQYGRALIAHWLERWDNEQARESLIQANVLPVWEADPYRNAKGEDGIAEFLSCMSSFAKQIVGINGRLVISIMPSFIQDKKGLQKWMKEAVLRLPNNLCILVYDIVTISIFEELSKQENVVTLHAQLNMQAALKEIVSSGDPNEPGVRFNLCVLNIGEALTKGDQAGVHHWGKAAVEIGKALKSNALQATGYVVYGTAIYQLKKYENALALYNHAEEFAMLGRNLGDATCAAVLLQALSMKAAAYLLLKKQEDAAKYYELMAIEAGIQGNHMMACEGYRLLAQIPRKFWAPDLRHEFLKKGFDAGIKLHPETQKFSSLYLVCAQLFVSAEKHKDRSLQATVNAHASSLWGEKWRDLENDNGTLPMISEPPNSISNVTRI